MNEAERKNKLDEVLAKPGGIAKVQVLILNDLCIKLVNEKDRKRRKEIRQEIEAISQATDSIIRKIDQDIKALEKSIGVL